MRKPMVNYFSLGKCCQAGLGFEKRRTTSRFGNTLVYAHEGLKALASNSAPRVSDVVSQLSIGSASTFSGSGSSIAISTEVSADELPRLLPTPGAGRQDTAHLPSLKETPRGKSKWNLEVVSTESIRGEDPPDNLPGNASWSLQQSAELLFLNVPSYAGGAHPWAWSRPAECCQQDLCSSETSAASTAVQDVGDGRLEIVSYGTGLSAAIDAANGTLWTPGRGSGQRLASAEGPFNIVFKPLEQANYTCEDSGVYLQVDGEFFIAHEPEEIQIRHWKTIKVASNSSLDGAFCRC